MATRIIVALALVACQKTAVEHKAPTPPPAPPPAVAGDPHAFLANTGPSLPPLPPAPSATPSARAKRTASGLYSEVLAQGSSNEKAKRADVVVMTLDAWDGSGEHVESYTTNEAFMLSRGMPGMIEGIMLMRKGEKRRLWISTALQGRFPLSTGLIVCDVELVDIIKG